MEQAKVWTINAFDARACSHRGQTFFLHAYMPCLRREDDTMEASLPPTKGGR
ncbi:hypothetical protein BIFCAT_00772 [Bifidobacterium catenulatum DSM 16992 = JCM 1194 = LMG 11043]|uniref:Uncharacterized protein n=1 Tax=Bifidobacterium catenulatum DSM 16992 = JCM 1194 = LMG 11043 TaxID=566552 RepID=B6XTL4_9BIFI|nr:hypothetical protein BIFCAT_00772 [Bifidobacterium catenulatum DSM 16992 = JCM 1194 = LMG 11043]